MSEGWDKCSFNQDSLVHYGRFTPLLRKKGAEGHFGYNNPRFGHLPAKQVIELCTSNYKK